MIPDADKNDGDAMRNGIIHVDGDKGSHQRH